MTVAIVLLSLTVSVVFGWAAVEGVMRLAKVRSGAGPLARQPEMVAAVVAVKGLGRWADLQTNPALTERFIIGTLASYVAAGACGYAGLALMG